MKWLKSWTLFESKEELNEFIQYLNHDLEEDGFQIRKGNVNDFLNFKYKNASTYKKSRPSIISDRYQEVKLLFNNSNVEVFDISSFYGGVHRTKYAGNSGFNLYDVEPSVKRLIDYAKSLGYTDFQVRKITQMSRKSEDVTKSFLGKGRLPESANKTILFLQVLIMK